MISLKLLHFTLLRTLGRTSMFLTRLPTTCWVNQSDQFAHTWLQKHQFLCRCLRFTDTAEMFMSLFASRSSLEKLGLWSIRSKGGNKVHRWRRSSDFLKDVQFRNFGLFHLLSLDLYPVHQIKSCLSVMSLHLNPSWIFSWHLYFLLHFRVSLLCWPLYCKGLDKSSQIQWI